MKTLRTLVLVLTCALGAVGPVLADDPVPQPPVPNGDPTDPNDGTIQTVREVVAPERLETLVTIVRFTWWVVR